MSRRWLFGVLAGLSVGFVRTPARADDGYRWVHTFAKSLVGYWPNPLIGHQTGPALSSWALFAALTMLPGSEAIYGATQEAYSVDQAGYHYTGGLAFKLTPPDLGATSLSRQVLHRKPVAGRGSVWSTS